MDLVELGILVVVVLKARDLKDPHSLSNSGPLAAISLSNSAVAFTTPVDRGQNPAWDYECRFTVWQEEIARNPAIITVSVYSGAEEEDRKLGTASIKLENWSDNQFDDWVDLIDSEGNSDGQQVFLEMTFYPALLTAQKATLERRPSKFVRESDRLSRPLPAPPVPTHAPPIAQFATPGPSGSSGRQLPLPGESQGDTWIDSISDRMRAVDINRPAVYSPAPHMAQQPSASYRHAHPPPTATYQAPRRDPSPTRLPQSTPVAQHTAQPRPAPHHYPSSNASSSSQQSAAVPAQQRTSPAWIPQPSPVVQPTPQSRPPIPQYPSSNRQPVTTPTRPPQLPQRQTSISSIVAPPSPPPPMYQAVAEEASMPGAFPAPSPQHPSPPPRPLLNPYTAPPPPPPVRALPIPVPPPPPRKPSPPPIRRSSPPRKNLPDPIRARQAALAARIEAEKADALYAARIAEELRLEDEKALRAQEELDARLIAELVEEEQKEEERKRREREVEDERIAREYGEESRVREEERKKREEEDERMAREMSET